MNMHSRPAHILAGVRLRRQQRILVDELARAYPNPVKTIDLVDVLHGHDPDGGPDRASYAVSKMMEHVRKRIEPVGWTIPPAIRGPGASGYRLVPIENGDKA